MRMLNRYAAGLLLVCGLAVLPGCTQFDTFRDNVRALTQAAGQANVSPKAIYIARNAFVAVENSATNYLLLPDCPAPNGSLACADPAAEARLVPFIRSGREARDGLVAYMKAHPDGAGAGSLYDKLTSANTTLRNILIEYKVIKDTP